MTSSRRAAASIGALVALLVFGWSSHNASGQQKVPFQGGIPVAPLGLAGHPLPPLPMAFDTAEGQRIRVVAVARSLSYPFALAFLPDDTMLVTERFGKLRVIRHGV